MGTVYEAVDHGTGRSVAVKTLAAHLGDDHGLRKRFAAEIETLKSLRHPCIVQLLAFGEEDGQPYFAMELVRGRSLEQVLRSGRTFDWRETVGIAVDITRALKSAHDHGVVHRDLKPANLLFPEEPSADAAVKLADFGIARLFGSSCHTMAGTIVGTAEYMAPEQATGGPVDHRVDLYALGLVIYAMLTGCPPFHGGQATDIIRRQRTEAAPRVSTRVAGIPAELDALIDRLLAKEPAKRPASALAVGRMLASIAAEVGAMPPEPAVPASDPGITLGPTDAIDLAAPTEDGARVETAASDPNVIAVNPASDSVRADVQTMPMPTTPQAPSPGLPQRVTVSAAAAGSPHPRVNRFTTLEELHRTSREEADARARQEFVLRSIAAASILALVVGAAYVLLRPPTADELHTRVRAIADAANADLRDARPLIEQFLERHGDDSRAAAIRELDRTLDLDSLEKRARRRRGDDDEMSPLEREYRAAMAREDESPLACAAALEAVLTLHESDPQTATNLPATAPPESQPALWLALVQRQIDRLEPQADREREQDVARAATVLAEAATLAVEA
ncbi:MAG: serine/threonine protein kinase, partial [Planctomycetota bacterium]